MADFGNLGMYNDVNNWLAQLRTPRTGSLTKSSASQQCGSVFQPENGRMNVELKQSLLFLSNLYRILL